MRPRGTRQKDMESTWRAPRLHPVSERKLWLLPGLRNSVGAGWALAGHSVCSFPGALSSDQKIIWWPSCRRDTCYTCFFGCHLTYSMCKPFFEHCKTCLRLPTQNMGHRQTNEVGRGMKRHALAPVPPPDVVKWFEIFLGVKTMARQVPPPHFIEWESLHPKE